MTKQAPPSPEEFDAELAAIQKQIARLSRDYRWTWNAAYGKSQSGPNVGTTSGASDPTGTIAVAGAKDRMRRMARTAARLTVEASSKLSEAADRLGRAWREPDVYNPDAGGRRYPRTITRAELAAAREAKRRREERGEGYGEA